VVGEKMNDPEHNPQVSIPPEEDARLPILEAEIEREWNQWRPKYVRDLKAKGTLQHQIRNTALWCIQVLNRYEERGLGADMGREAIRALILPEFDHS
jgi:hypothetical protein